MKFEVRMLFRFRRFWALGSWGVFEPDQLLLLVSSPSAKMDRPVRKRFVYLTRNFKFMDFLIKVNEF